MAKARKSAGRRGPSGESPGVRVARPERAWRASSRWLQVAVLVLCLAAGGVALERFSRPRPPLPPQPDPRKEPAPEAPAPAGASASVGKLTPQEQAEEARQLAARLEAHHQSAEALNLAGMIYQTVHDADKAMDCWEKTLKLRPDWPDVHFNIGYAAWEVANYERAKPHLLEALAAKPELGELRYYLADSLLKLGEAGEAIRVMEGAGDPDRYGPKGRCLLGQAYGQGGDLVKAKESFEAALAMDANYRDAHFGLIRIMMRLGRPEEAKKHSDAVARLEQIQGRHELEASRPGRAGQVADNADEVRRRDLAVFYRSAAEICRRLGRDAEAEQLLLRGAALWPEGAPKRKGPEVAPAP